ncbi:MAG: hypothetical protein KGK08_04445 [Acidobacteriota bacterium]|nr:hypothetical protein [Acidobacteriota bacterium]
MGALLPCLALAQETQLQETKLWTVDRYDDLERGTLQNVAISSDGQLLAGPRTDLLYLSGGSYVWSVASDGKGAAYVGLGGTAAGSAAVVRVHTAGDTRDDDPIKLWTGPEFAVQALRVTADGSLLAATSPDGRVYRFAPGARPGEAPRVLWDAASTQEKPKYVWDIAEAQDGSIYIATGAPAVVYRVPPDGGKPEVLFQTSDQHIRCLLVAPDGTLWAGTEGAGVLYRVAATGGHVVAGAQPFAVYAAPRKEITALARDADGSIYAAGVGTRGSTTLPPLPVTGALGVTVTISQAGSSGTPGANALLPEGSELYRIAPDGTPSRLATLKDDVVYSLAVHQGKLLAATGNRGRICTIATDGSGRFTDLARLDAAEAMAFAPDPTGLLVSTSNSGKLFHLGDTTAVDASYTSEILDAQQFARWGRMEVRPAPADSVDLYTRTGNVPSASTGWSAWSRVQPDGATTVPPARFAQWKVVLRTGGTVDRVAWNYLPKNTAPVVDAIVVQPGARVTPTATATTPPTVQIVFPGSQSGTATATDATATAPLAAQRDRTATTVRWQAHDDSGDALQFSVWYRGTGETNWRLLKDKISDRFYSFDSTTLPDGEYTLRVMATDAPAHPAGAALTGVRVSDPFVVDTTPPVPGTLEALLQAGATSGTVQIRARFQARDALSPISHAEYSLDGEPWQVVEPVGGLSDSLAESYDFIAVPAAGDGNAPRAGEHVLAIRVYDRFENAVTAKTVVR